MVHPTYRGRGIASLLLSEAETAAKSLVCSLLVLDTEAGSTAESVYMHLGWTRVGEVPGYALSSEGAPRAAVYFYKQIVT